MNISILLITHGGFGGELIEAVSEIMGRREGVDFFTVPRGSKLDKIKDDLSRRVQAALSDSQVLILTDIPGGTPTNIALPFLSDKNVEILTGVNMPMLLTSIHRRSSVGDVRELAETVSDAARKSITDCREFFNE